jgi:hypothetical protein
MPGRAENARKGRCHDGIGRSLAVRVARDRPSAFDGRWLCDRPWCCDLCCGRAQLFSRCYAGSFHSARAEAGDKRHSRLKAQSDLFRRVLCGLVGVANRCGAGQAYHNSMRILRLGEGGLPRRCHTENEARGPEAAASCLVPDSAAVPKVSKHLRHFGVVLEFP